jgi:hypothetical protein
MLHEYPSDSRPTEMSFPMRDNGVVVTTGKETEIFDRSVLSLDGQSAQIETYTLPGGATMEEVERALGSARNATVARGRFLDSNAPDGQTFAAVKDRDGDTLHETVIFYFSVRISPNEVNAILTNEFGVSRSAAGAIRLDGGNSAQIRCAEGLDIRNREFGFTRPIPHVFLIQQAP